MHLDMAIGGLLTSVLLLNVCALRVPWSDKVRFTVHILAPLVAFAVFGARNIRANEFSHEAFEQEGVTGFDRIVQEYSSWEGPLFYVLCATIAASAVAFAIRWAKHRGFGNIIAVLLWIAMLVFLVLARQFPPIIPG
jgi:hypothetical protein